MRGRLIQFISLLTLRAHHRQKRVAGTARFLRCPFARVQSPDPDIPQDEYFPFYHCDLSLHVNYVFASRFDPT